MYSRFFCALILAFSLVYELSGQEGERPPCGQDLHATKSALSVLQQPHTKGPISVQQRNQLIVPVVVHVVWHTWDENITDELIVSQLEALNRDFNAQNRELEQVPYEFQDRIANVGISFCLAAKTPGGQPTNGIVRVRTIVDEAGISDSLFFDSTGGSHAWDTERYLNIWVANTGKYLSGYGTYPALAPDHKTGVVINPKFFGLNGDAKYGSGRTLVHEIGHYFGLKHVWASDPFCEADDDIEDTPRQKNPHYGCPEYPQSSCTDSDMFMNFMDYVDDPCMYMFTTGQKEKIWANIENLRPALLKNTVEYYCLSSMSNKGFDFTLSPNPATSTLTLRFAEQEGGLKEVQVFDLLGKLRKSVSMLANLTILLEINDLELGMYIVKVNSRAQLLVKT
jgi:hypothetical protein